MQGAARLEKRLQGTHQPWAGCSPHPQRAQRAHPPPWQRRRQPPPQQGLLQLLPQQGLTTWPVAWRLGRAATWRQGLPPQHREACAPAPACPRPLRWPPPPPLLPPEWKQSCRCSPPLPPLLVPLQPAGRLHPMPQTPPPHLHLQRRRPPPPMQQLQPLPPLPRAPAWQAPTPRTARHPCVPPQECEQAHSPRRQAAPPSLLRGAAASAAGRCCCRPPLLRLPAPCPRHARTPRPRRCLYCGRVMVRMLSWHPPRDPPRPPTPSRATKAKGCPAHR